MVYVLTMCVGVTWGMCNFVVRQEFKTMAACQAERAFQYKHVKDIQYARCDEV